MDFIFATKSVSVRIRGGVGFVVRFLVVVLLTAIVSSVYSEDKTSPEQSLLESEKLINSDKTHAKGIADLSKFVREKKDSDEKFEAKALLSKIYREEKKLDKAVGIVSDCTEFEKVSINSSFKYKSCYLMAFLEAAHCKALDKNEKHSSVREAFKMLDYAVNNTEGIDNARSNYKYGAVLFDLGEFRKSDTYLKKALDVGNACSDEKQEIASTGDNKIPADGLPWQKLKRQIDELLFLVSMELLREDFGEGYALYVKMRTYYDRKDFYKAFSDARKLKEDFSGEVYGEAGRFYWCRMLLENDFGGELRDKNLPCGMKEMHKFIEDKPDGLYRGEALMELGRVELEKNWDSDKSSEYYTKALEWFRTVRERKDVAELYAVPENISKISAPQKPISGLDEWFRIVYREPSPKEIVNIKTAPWYMDEMEKECLFMMGFFLLMENQPDKAKECFSQVKGISKELTALDSKGIPNILWRLESACNIGYMVFPPEEKKYLKGKNKLICFYAELNYLLEKFDVAKEFYRKILDDPKSKEQEKAIAWLGLGICCDMTRGVAKEDSVKEEEYFKNALKLAGTTPIAGAILMRLGFFYQANSLTAEKSIDCYKNYLKSHSGGRYEEKALFRLSYACLKSNKRDEGEKVFSQLEERYSKSCYLPRLKELFSQPNTKKEN
ncbi:MAG: hypothetical protein WAX69_15790 [Victivallales bacterium]